jgi:hypothetical protein
MGRWKLSALAVAMLAGAWMALATGGCDSGDGPGSECTPGKDPEPGCGLDDCRAGRNDCGGIVYACDSSGRIIELGTCDVAPHDGGPNGPCVPGSEPVPGCGVSDCQLGRNDCGGAVFICDMSGQIVQGGTCDFPMPVVDAAVPLPPDARPR